MRSTPNGEGISEQNMANAVKKMRETSSMEPGFVSQFNAPCVVYAQLLLLLVKSHN